MTTCFGSSTIDKLTIIQGTDKEIIVRIVVEETQEPYDFTGFTAPADEIKGRFIKTDGSALEILFSLSEIDIVNAAGGKIKLILSDTNTALLKKGLKQSFEVEINKGGEISCAQFIEKLEVLERIV